MKVDMKILGIDYGRKKIGLAVSEGLLAQPLKVLRYKKFNILCEQLEKKIKALGIEKIVMGISEGTMAEETKEFGRRLQEKLATPVEYQDETLTTKEAQRLSIEAGINRKKRKKMEDAYAAALILQAYLDNF